MAAGKATERCLVRAVIGVSEPADTALLALKMKRERFNPAFTCAVTGFWRETVRIFVPFSRLYTSDTAERSLRCH